MDELKKCGDCGDEKTISDFYFRNKAKNLRMSCCKKCSNQRTRDFKRQHPDKQREYSKTNRRRHIERIKKTDRRLYIDNAEQKKAQAKQWADQNPEKRKLTHQKYWDSKKSPYGYELRQVIRAIRKLQQVITNGKEQD